MVFRGKAAGLVLAALSQPKPRVMAWADIVPLGTYPTWGLEPNPSLAELETMLEGAKRLLPANDNGAPRG
jgi:hypothetical protein